MGALVNMKLYLVRHGKYVSSESDPQEPLSAEGREETAAIAKKLKGKDCPIDEIWHSTKKRAKETAEIIAKTAGCPLIEKEGLKPMDSIGPIVNTLVGTNKNLMLVGHLPFMEKLLSLLLFGEEQASPVNFTNSCVLALEEVDHQWKISWMMTATSS